MAFRSGSQSVHIEVAALRREYRAQTLQLLLGQKVGKVDAGADRIMLATRLKLILQRLVIGVLDKVHYIDESCLRLFIHPARHILHIPVCEEIVKLTELGARDGQTRIPRHIYVRINHERHVGSADHV